jgi:hypothetical protein
MRRSSAHRATVLLAGLVILLAGRIPEAGGANDYTNSAHGDSTIGVLRTSSQLSSSSRGNNYASGNCAHCHEQHGSIDGSEPNPAGGSPSNFVLFADTNPTSHTTNFCFNCHQGVGSYQTGGITNNDYSTTFGGQSSATTTTVKDAFNTTGSVHDLADIQTELLNHSPPSGATWSFASTDNACSGCHNPHFSQKNNATGLSYATTYFLDTAVSRPGDRFKLPPNNLWGDGSGERMSDHVSGVSSGAYRAPFYVGATTNNTSTTHEPDGQTGSVAGGSTNVTGANTPDYPTLCLDCHGSSAPDSNGSVSGTSPSRTVPEIPWFSADTGFAARAQHGQANAAGSAAGNRRAPYTTDGSNGTSEDTSTNFVLSCLDCHEPHGDQQTNGEYLLRSTVNGYSTSLGNSSGQWLNFCTACHTLTGGTPNHGGLTATNDCSASTCHGHGGATQNY